MGGLHSDAWRGEVVVFLPRARIGEREGRTPEVGEQRAEEVFADKEVSLSGAVEGSNEQPSVRAGSLVRRATIEASVAR